MALLDGNGLNELVRRAGLTQPLFPLGESTNLMLGTFRSMTQSFQWMGEVVDADTGSIRTKFGICGPENGGELKKIDRCGTPNGFVLWRHPEAREKIFRVIFKGYGPGPGSTSLADHIVTDLPTAVSGAPEAARAFRLGSDQTDYMREIVAVMRGKISGTVSGATATAPSAATPAVRLTIGGRPAPTKPAPVAGSVPTAETITGWGQRCCARDVAELRAALRLVRASSPRIQDPAVLASLGRRVGGGQVDALLGQLDAALTAFTNTRDATTAAAALATISRQLDTLARSVTGT